MSAGTAPRAGGAGARGAREARAPAARSVARAAARTAARVAVLDDWQNVAQAAADWTHLAQQAQVEFFRAPFASEDEAAQALADFDIILAMRERTRFPRSLAARLPRLKMFGLTGARATQVDVAGMIERGVTVCHTGGGASVESTAELALGLMLAAARRIPQGDAATREGRFQLGTRAGFVLAGKTLGVLGLGRVGTRVATYGRALGMQVLAWSPHLTDARARVAGVERADKAALLARADVASVHLVLSDRTRGVLGADDLAQMKRGAILVNTSRGPLVDEAALIRAVQSGHLIAALDVYDREPLGPDHPLIQSANTVLTPHLGYSVLEVYAEFYAHSIENALAFLAGKPIRVLTHPGH